MSGETPLTPACFEKLAQSYADLIRAGEKTPEDVPTKPAALRPRVDYLLREPNMGA